MHAFLVHIDKLTWHFLVVAGGVAGLLAFAWNIYDAYFRLPIIGHIKILTEGRGLEITLVNPSNRPVLVHDKIHFSGLLLNTNISPLKIQANPRYVATLRQPFQIAPYGIGTVKARINSDGFVQSPAEIYFLYFVRMKIELYSKMRSVKKILFNLHSCEYRKWYKRIFFDLWIFVLMLSIKVRVGRRWVEKCMVKLIKRSSKQSVL